MATSAEWGEFEWGAAEWGSSETDDAPVIDDDPFAGGLTIYQVTPERWG